MLLAYYYYVAIIITIAIILLLYYCCIIIILSSHYYYAITMLKILQNLLPIFHMFFLAIFLTACIKEPADYGYNFSQQNIGAIKDGMSKYRVRQILGSPSVISDVTKDSGRENWHYITSQVGDGILKDNQIKNSKIFTIEFTDDLISKVNLQESEPKEIKIATESTKSEGKNFTLIEQFIGNLGKFNTQ